MKKIPMRRCVATGEQCPKKDLIRIVKTKENEIFIDETGKKNGLGAYLKKSKEAIELARKKGILDRNLDTKIPDEIYEELLNYVK